MQSRTPSLLPILLLALVLTGASPQDKTSKAQPKPKPQTQPKSAQPAEENPYVKRFEELDRDKNGYVSLAEWPLDRESYRTVDRNQDGRLSRGELLTPNVLRRDDRFRQLDTNGDGRLSPTERRPGGRVLDGMDRNKDGYLTLNEYDESRGIGTTWSPRAGVREQQRFQILDRNRDNRLTRPEWTGGGASFQRIDRNRDGVISPSEWPGR
jgi:Ca2+-binding EF-hand superfamily protein